MQKKKVLVIRRGLFGDTVVAIRALEFIRSYEHPDVEIHYLSDIHTGRSFLTSKCVIGHLQLIDMFLNFRAFSNLKNFIYNLNLFLKLFGNYNKLVILECNYSTSTLFIKKCRFLGILLGIKSVIYDNEIPMKRDNSHVYISTNLYNFIFKSYA